VLLSHRYRENSAISDWVWAVNGTQYPVDLVVKIVPTAIAPLLSPTHIFTKPPLTKGQTKGMCLAAR
jgi:hypothetical protein